MAEDARTLIFLDAGVLVVASRAPTGASATAVQVCQGKRFRGALTAIVLQEARTAVAQRLDGVEMGRFHEQLAAINPDIVPAPSLQRLLECIPLTTEKDAHVLAAALECRAGYLLTLDRRHLLTPAVQAARLPLRVLTPGDFLLSVLRA